MERLTLWYCVNSNLYDLTPSWLWTCYFTKCGGLWQAKECPIRLPICLHPSLWNLWVLLYMAKGILQKWSLKDLRWGDCLISTRWTQDNHNYPYQRGPEGFNWKQGDDGSINWNEMTWRGRNRPQGYEHRCPSWKPAPAGKGEQMKSSPRFSRKNQPCRQVDLVQWNWFQTPGLQNWNRVNLCWVKSLGLW